MQTWAEILFANPIGLLSLFTLLFILVMGAYFAYFFMKKSAGEDDAQD